MIAIDCFVKAVYEHGAFVPECPVDLPDGTEVVLAIHPANRVQPPRIGSEEERKRVLRDLVERMKANALPANAPRFTRDEMMNAVDTNILFYAHDPRYCSFGRQDGCR